MAGKTHRLKTWPDYFNAVRNGAKPFDVRFDDRGYKVGDRVLLQEYEPRRKEFTGKEVLCRITYVLASDAKAVKDALSKDWVVLGLDRVLYRYVERF